MVFVWLMTIEDAIYLEVPLVVGVPGEVWRSHSVLEPEPHPLGVQPVEGAVGAHRQVQHRVRQLPQVVLLNAGIQKKWRVI